MHASVVKKVSLLTSFSGCLAVHLVVGKVGKADRSALEEVIDSPCLAGHVPVIVSRQIAHSAVHPL